MMEMTKAIKKAIEWRHAGSWPLALGIIVGTAMWYTGDADITGMPPSWILMAAMIAVSILLNEFEDAITDDDPEGDSQDGNEKDS